MKPIRKVLIANRGEIAVRIARTLRELDRESVAVFSPPDRTALHVLYANEAYPVGNYLDIEEIVNCAMAASADAVHPGYGFLAENADFARACQAKGLRFLGPKPEVIQAMGDKVCARRTMKSRGVHPVPGTAALTGGFDEVRAAANRIGYPVLIKASSGGGGKGMRRVDAPDGLKSAFEQAQGEARTAFGDDTLYLEKFLRRPRHVEVQVVADSQGSVIHLGERDCSLQRRHQKVIEETPSPAVSEDLRERLTSTAVEAARAANYEGAGTVEFLLAEDGSFYFLEMNTRLQVEHPITELVTGLDIVALQVAVAEGRSLPLRQEEVRFHGAAMECRIYAEDPEQGFLPSPGRIQTLRSPGGPGIREDSGIYQGFEIPLLYDPLLSKLASYGSDRKMALRRMLRAVQEYRMTGVKTNLQFHERLLESPEFQQGNYDTGFLEETFMLRDQHRERPNGEVAMIAAGVSALLRNGDRKETQPTASGWKRSAIQMGLRGRW